MIQLPLTSDPCRTFTTTLGESRYRMTTRWNERSSVWTLDVADADTEDLLVSSMPLVLGADVLRSFCPRIGSMYVIDTAGEPGYGAEPKSDDLGSRVQVVWVAPGEVVA